jgi:site-specific DNA-methyltransferase (adenine-specific)
MNWPEWTSPDGRIRLINADCLEVLPHVQADAVVTDPPYGMSYAGSPGTSNLSTIHSAGPEGLRTKERVVGDDKPFDPSPWLDLPCVMSGAQHYYHRLPPRGSLHSWDKRGEYKPLSFADADIIWCSRFMAPRTYRCVWRGLCRHVENLHSIEHPTQKPVSLMQWMIELLDVDSEVLILDPFAGSCTTAIACIRTDRRCICIEKEAKYWQIGIDRCKREYARTVLFNDQEAVA